LRALRKRGNMLGAALFAVLAPRRRRSEVVRALVAFQAAYNYLDTLAEQLTSDPVGNCRRLHNALLLALQPEAAQRDYYAGYPRCDDGGLLNAMVEACRGSLRVLPSNVFVADPVQRAAARIVDFQSLNLGVRQGAVDGLERWARSSTPPESGLRWWETAAAGGSSLVVQPSDDPVGNGERLHEALLEALDGPARGDRYALHERREDGGYLSEVATVCREAARQLPSFGLVRDSALAAARRIVSFQSLNLGVAGLDRRAAVLGRAEHAAGQRSGVMGDRGGSGLLAGRARAARPRRRPGARRVDRDRRGRRVLPVDRRPALAA
jgi:Protein of unknown function (DUF2600)